MFSFDDRHEMYSHNTVEKVWYGSPQSQWKPFIRILFSTDDEIDGFLRLIAQRYLVVCS